MKNFWHGSAMLVCGVTFSMGLSAGDMAKVIVDETSTSLINHIANSPANKVDCLSSIEKPIAKRKNTKNTFEQNTKSTKDEEFEDLKKQRKMELQITNTMMLRNQIELPNVFKKRMQISKGHHPSISI